MSRKELHKNNIGYRILDLCSEFSTDKEFLNKCNISNPAFITNIRKGSNQNPGAKFLEQIVRGTGCSGTWLLTGEGEKYEIRENAASVVSGENSFSLITQAFELLDRIERKVTGSSTDPLPADVELVLSRLLNTSLERRHKDQNSGE
ncbi:hypothetical protein [Gracilimonas tropica]|uniref:hypothetical protein n=1 Tax=Gracilimonas tropica TaxID=454600 RepID=UPI00037346F2|nr:hypothetical protein [Gracilimonas tropica]